MKQTFGSIGLNNRPDIEIQSTGIRNNTFLPPSPNSYASMQKVPSASVKNQNKFKSRNNQESKKEVSKSMCLDAGIKLNFIQGNVNTTKNANDSHYVNLSQLR